MDAVTFVSELDRIASAPELAAAGVPRRELTRLVASGELRRPRNGWYSTLDPLHPRFRAVRIGGRLTSASALAEMGAWMLHPPPRLEVAVPRGSARLRADRNAVIHWGIDGARSQGSAVVGIHEALIRVVLDHDLEVSVPCLDWAMSTGRLDRFSFEELILALPMTARCVRLWIDPASQSLLESVARVRLRRRGWPVRSQVRVGDLGAIDLVVDQVALELDGREHHESRFEADRRKDLQITIEGRHSIRVSYAMLVKDWSRVESAIAAALRARGRGHVQNSVNAPAEPRGTRPAPGARTTSD